MSQINNLISPDAAADALSARTARAIKGNKRRLAELTRVARTAALACNVRDTKRISMRIELGSPIAQTTCDHLSASVVTVSGSGQETRTNSQPAMRISMKGDAHE